MLPSITLCCWVSPHRKKSYVSMWKNAASALAAAIIIDGVVNHCGDEVCKWTRMAMGRLVWYTCCKWQEQCKAHSMWHKFCNNRILSQRPPQSVEYHCLLLDLLPHPCMVPSNICPHFKTVSPAADISGHSMLALLHSPLCLSAPKFSS